MEKLKSRLMGMRFLPGGQTAPAYLGALLFGWQLPNAFSEGSWKLWTYPPLIAFLLWSGISGTRDRAREGSS
jgi:hypothetical protein